MTQPIENILADFDFLDDWEDRYRYIISLGNELDPMSEEAHNPQNKVQGCVSQVWLETEVGEGSDPVIRFRGDSDAHIVRGLVAIVLALYSGRKASEILDADAEALLKRIGLDEHLTPQRANGLRAMIRRIRHEAEQALEPQASR